MKLLSVILSLSLCLGVSLTAAAAAEPAAPAAKPEDKPKPEEPPKPMKGVTLEVTAKESRAKDNKDAAVANLAVCISLANRTKAPLTDLDVLTQIIFQETKGKRNYFVENIEDKLSVESKKEGKLEKNISSTKAELAERRVSAWVVTVKDSKGNFVSSKASAASWGKVADSLYGLKPNDRFDANGELIPASN